VVAGPAGEPVVDVEEIRTAFLTLENRAAQGQVSKDIAAAISALAVALRRKPVVKRQHKPPQAYRGGPDHGGRWYGRGNHQNNNLYELPKKQPPPYQKNE